MPWTRSLHAIAPQHHYDEQPPHTGDRTTYLSTNNQDRSIFYADSPAGSRRAARLHKTDVENQPDFAQAAEKTAQKKRLREKNPRRLTVQGEPVQQPRNTKGSSSPTLPRQSGEDMENERQACCLCNTNSPVQKNRRSRRGASPEASPPPVTVYRYESDGHIEYHKKTLGVS